MQTVRYISLATRCLCGCAVSCAKTSLCAASPWHHKHLFTHLIHTRPSPHTHTHTYIASLDISQMFQSESNNLWWVCVTELHHAAGQVQPVISDAGEITSMHFGWRAITACALPCSVASSPRCHNACPDFNYVTQVECKMIKKNLLSTVSTKVLSQINKSVRLPVICCQVNSCETHDASMDAAEVQVWSEVDGIFNNEQHRRLLLSGKDVWTLLPTGSLMLLPTRSAGSKRSDCFCVILRFALFLKWTSAFETVFYGRFSQWICEKNPV